jgi:TRAP-type mannitol/chloroaromatic compound transport system, small permease component
MAKSLIPLAGILLTIQGISEVFRSIICIQTGQWPARLVVAEETEKILMRAAEEGGEPKMLFSLTNPEIAIFMMGFIFICCITRIPNCFYFDGNGSWFWLLRLF